jgi:predicted Fe-Mo cluster-binding NifX family protein
VTFCRKLNVPVLGIVENMNGFICPSCGVTTSILRGGGGRRIADDMEIPFWGSIPLDPQITVSCDDGTAFLETYPESRTAGIMKEIIRPIVSPEEQSRQVETDDEGMEKEAENMRIAIPLTEGRLCMHFGHCDCFSLVDVDMLGRKIIRREDIEAPPHQPGLLPPWLADRGANVIIAGGMGHRAQELFDKQGIIVVVGAPAETPEKLVEAYMSDSLVVGENVCDH